MMTSRRHRVSLCLAFTVTFACAPAHAADPALAAPICETLKKHLLSEAKTYKPEGGRAQLVMALAGKFQYDGAKLRRVKADIDEVTTASCPMGSRSDAFDPQDEDVVGGGELTS